MASVSIARGQSSLEYLLLITGGIVVAAVVLTLLIMNTIPEAQDILEENIATSQSAVQTSFENTQTPLTNLTFTPYGEDGKVVITYSAPGAGHFLLVEETGKSVVVNSLDYPEDFDNVTDANVFGLYFFENEVTSSGVMNCTEYFYRMRACTKDMQTCLVSDVKSAIPQPTEGCPTS